ncbi:MAG: hypothetical protein LZT29_03535 [Pantoea stewartii]|nr:MAG: hypothetical protein LZT29_03535 [Pantoea stewartii]
MKKIINITFTKSGSIAIRGALVVEAVLLHADACGLNSLIEYTK